jgi:hypothetical protein
MYGPGDSDVLVMGMAIDTSENILLGGQSKFIQTTTGEGFVMLVDKWGEATFSKTYATGASNGDIVNKVVVEETASTYIAVGTSDTGTNAFFFLAFNSAGTILKNLLIATDTSLVVATSQINQLYLQGTDAHVVFDTSVVGIIDTAGAAVDRYVGIVGRVGNIIRCAVHPGNTQYSFFAIINGFIGTYYVNATGAGAGSKDIATDDLLTYVTTAALQTSDFDNIANPAGAWVGVYPTTGSRFLAFYYTIGYGAEFPGISVQYEVTTAFAPISLTISYVSGTAFYMAAMLTNGQGSVYYNAGTSGKTKTMTTSLSGGWFIGAKTLSGTVYVTAGTKTNGESASLASSQAIIFKSDLEGSSFDVNPYNCYNNLPFTAKSDAAYALHAGTVNNTARTHIHGTSAQSTNTDVPVDSTSFVIRAESNDAGGNACKLQLPTFAMSATPITYSVGTDDPTTIKAMVTHCQGATMTFTPTVGGASEVWAVGGSDTMTIKPNLVTPTHCCVGSHKLDVQAYAENTVTNPSTDNVYIMFTNKAPIIATAITDQTFYKGQGLTSLTGLSITSSNTLTFSIVTNITSANYSTLTIDATTGDPITININSNFTGTVLMTITATDSAGYTTTDSFNVYVNECSQTNCNTCTGSGVNQCSSCLIASEASDCFVGDGTPDNSPEITTDNSTFLNSGVGDADSRGGVGTSVALVAAAGIGASM